MSKYYLKTRKKNVVKNLPIRLLSLNVKPQATYSSKLFEVAVV